MQLALSQRTLDEGTRPSFCAGRKLGEVEQALLWTLLREDPQCPSRVLLDQGRRTADTDYGEPAPCQPMAGAMAAQWSQRTATSNRRPSACCLCSRGRPGHAPSVVCGCASVCPLARPTGCLWPGGGPAHADSRGLEADASG